MLGLHWAAEGEKHAKGHSREWYRLYTDPVWAKQIFNCRMLRESSWELLNSTLRSKGINYFVICDISLLICGHFQLGVRVKK